MPQLGGQLGGQLVAPVTNWRPCPRRTDRPPFLMPHRISADIEYDNCGQILGYFISAVLIILDPLKIFVPHEVLLNIMTQITPLMPHEISVDLVYTYTIYVYNIMIRSCSVA